MRYLFALLLSCASTLGFSQGQIIISVTPATCAGCCDGEAEVSVSGCWAGAFTYMWTGPGPISQTNSATELCEGVYTFAVTDENGQTAEMTFTLIAGGPQYTVTENVLLDCDNSSIELGVFYFPPVNSGIGGEACIAPSDCEIPDSVEWYLSGILISDSNCITNLVSGNYILIVYNQNGEATEIEVPIVAGGSYGLYIYSACLNDLDDYGNTNNLQISPNPASTELHLILSEELIGAQYEIIDLIGNQVLRGVLNSSSETLTVGHLASGNYFIRIITPLGELTSGRRFAVSR